MNIKEVYDALTTYSKETGRPKFSDAFIYACFLDYLDEYRVEAKEDYVVTQGVTIETIWDNYTSSSFVINIEYVYEHAESWARDWFLGNFSTFTGEEEDTE